MQERNQCLKVIKSMLKHPASELFSDPVDPDQDGVPDYFEIIKNPSDLGTILRRLENNEYLSVDEWKNDVCLIWKNAESYNGVDSPITCLAKSLESVFNKLCIKNRIFNSNEWISHVSYLYDCINGLIQKSPPIVSVHFRGKDLSNPMSPSEMKTLSEAASSLNSRNEVLQMAQLLSLYGVNIDTKKEEVTVDLSSLPIGALRALSRYTKDKAKLHNQKSQKN